MYIQKTVLCKKAQSKSKIKKKERKKSRNIKEKLITKKKRAKEQRECSLFMLMSMRALVLNFGQV